TTRVHAGAAKNIRSVIIRNMDEAKNSAVAGYKLNL
ncbi:MAG: hypothetical protein LiPW16_293, partial [Microgenomates group bacterium LiPW_16]